jgi:hypothetical protein
MYYEQALVWMSVFSPDQFLFIDYITACDTGMVSDQRQAVLDATNFLGLPSGVSEAWLDENEEKLFAIHSVPQGRRVLYDEMSDFARSTMQSWFAPHNEKLYKLIGQRFMWDDDSINAPPVISIGTKAKAKGGKRTRKEECPERCNRPGVGRCYRSVAVKSAWCRVCCRQWK